MSDWPVWENEDGDVWVEVDPISDRDEAGQRLADDTGCVYGFLGRTKIKTQACECVPTHDAAGERLSVERADDERVPHGGDECWEHPGEGCVVREDVDVWHFEYLGEADDDTDGLAAVIFRPAPKPDPNQLAAGL